MIIVTAYLTHNIYNTGKRLAIFRVERAGNDLYLLHGIILNFKRTRTIKGVHDWHPIQQVGYFTASSPSNMQLAIFTRGDPSLQLQNIIQLLHCHLLNVFTPDDLNRCSQIFLHNGHRCRDDDLLHGQRFFGKLDIYPRCEVNRNLDIDNFLGTVTNHRNPKSIRPGRNVQNDIFSF